MQRSKPPKAQDRKDVFEEIVKAFSEKYSWLGGQAARELLISSSTWNIQQNSDPPFRYRTHTMLAWEKGWAKSTLLRTMSDILGDDMTSVIGKVSEAAMRGSVSGGTFTPPKPLESPIVISTEFGQTSFEDELLNLFLNQLEEGYTNVALNKIGSLPESQKNKIENDYGGKIDFEASNSFNLKCDFVFWGATYDPTMLDDNALRSRFNVVTPSKPLDHEITRCMDSSPSVIKQLDKTTVRDCRNFLKSNEKVPTDFRPPKPIYRKYGLSPRESRDIQSYMAARNWWGLEVSVDIMEDYIEHLQQSRKVSTMKPEDRVFNLIFDDPKTYSEIIKETGLSKREIYKIVDRIGANQYNLGADGKTRWVIWSGQDEPQEEEGEDGFLDGLT